MKLQDFVWGLGRLALRGFSRSEASSKDFSTAADKVKKKHEKKRGGEAGGIRLYCANNVSVCLGVCICDHRQEEWWKVGTHKILKKYKMDTHKLLEMRRATQATSVCGLKLLVYEAFSY